MAAGLAEGPRGGVRSDEAFMLAKTGPLFFGRNAAPGAKAGPRRLTTRLTISQPLDRMNGIGSMAGEAGNRCPQKDC